MAFIISDGYIKRHPGLMKTLDLQDVIIRLILQIDSLKIQS